MPDKSAYTVLGGTDKTHKRATSGAEEIWSVHDWLNVFRLILAAQMLQKQKTVQPYIYQIYMSTSPHSKYGNSV